MRQQPPAGGDLHTPPTAGLEVAPLLRSPASQNQEQQQQDERYQQQDEQPTERWMAASQLSGWKGPGTMLLSLGAVSGAGLLGAMRQLAARAQLLSHTGFGLMLHCADQLHPP
jgi:hypothetical protein